MLYYMAANAPVPTPNSNLMWIWFVVGLLLGFIIRGKF